MTRPWQRWLMPVAALLGGTVPGLRAQAPLTLPAPLAGKIAPTVSGREIMLQESARRAHDLGMPSVAVDFYRQLVDAPGVDRAEMNLALATALLDGGRSEEAEVVLQAMPEPHDAAWRLRTGLAAFQAKRRGDAQAQWDAIKAEEISDADRAWYWFLTGALWDTAAVRDITRANEFYLKAQAAATTELTQARFQLAGEQVRLRLIDRPSDASIRQMRDTAKQYAGRPVGYDAARTLAVALAESGQRAEAVTTLESTLRAVPARERGVIDELRFALGMIGDRKRGGAGRNALVQLLETGLKTERQQQALQLLAQASNDEPARKQFREELDRLIAARPPHPILESLLYYRAQLALTGKDFARAEEDAEALLKQFPLSPLRVHALGVLTQSAWEQDRFRRAADYASKARADLAVLAASTPGSGGFALGRADLGVFAAEASFRGGDYRNAADAYAAVLRERPADFEAGRLASLMYMRVLAEIRTGSNDAAKVLDEVERDPAFDLEHRWRAEWSLARDLQLRGEARVGEAFARISALLREPTAGSELKPELRARIAWLQARLAFDNRQPQDAIRFASDLLVAPSDIDPKLKAQIASEAMLLKARAEFALARETVALETLGRLRADYPTLDAAINSYLIEAEHYAAQDKIAEARDRLIKLTDNPAYKDSEYVPYALYRLALLSERLGREENLEEANKRIEELVTNPAAAADQALVFVARLRQGDIYRKRGDFPAAQRAYEDLVNRYPQRPDVVLALLALADSRNAQSSADVAPSTSHSDAAQLIYEQLRDRVDAPRDVRVEAGYKLGALLARRGKLEEAARVWWQVVDDKSPTERDAKRPYWIARTLLDLGDLLEKRGSIEDAKSAYQLLLARRLPFGEAVAQTRLQQLGLPPAKVTP